MMDPDVKPDYEMRSLAELLEILYVLQDE